MTNEQATEALFDQFKREIRQRSEPGFIVANAHLPLREV
jgi:hypothetical protein